MQTLTTANVPCVVLYNEKLYLCYRVEDGKARLMDENEVKFSGTPGIDKCQVVKPLFYKTFNGHNYCQTKKGIFSCTTGNKVKMPEILAMFQTI